MKVGIIGDKKRAVVWEKHLRPLTAVREVIITPSISDLHNTDTAACILLDDSSDNLKNLGESIRLGLHTYLVSVLPVDHKELKKIYHLVQESDVRVQFSHWPTISPASQWMKQQLPKPGFIQVIREHPHISYSENKVRFSHAWIDEIAWIVKWMDMSTHRIEAKHIIPGNPDSGIQVYLKFENGASASLFYLVPGSKNSHRRIVSSPSLLLDCHVEQQSVKKTVVGDNQRLTVESQTFDASKSAGLSASLFFKAIKLKRNTAFTAYDALNASMVIDNIKELLRIE
jgi:hypothetical protein